MKNRTRRTRGDDGLSLLEMTISITILLLTLLSFQVVLAGSITSYRRSRMTTLGQQVADDQLEKARNWPWDSLGTIGGNPPGTVPPEQDIVVGTVPLHVSTTITDLPGDSTTTGLLLNAREVTVTVTGNRLQSVTLTTRVASPSAASKLYGAVAVVVRDTCKLNGQDGVPNFGVKLGTGPSASPTPRGGFTGPDGKILFTQLSPTPLPPAAGDYYDVTAADLSVYNIDDPSYLPVASTSPSAWNLNVQRYLDPSQVQDMNIGLFKKGTLVLHVNDPDTGQEVQVPGSLTVQKIVPNPAYNAKTQTGGTPTLTVGYNAINLTTPSPVSSITNATSTINIKPCDTYNYLFTPRGQAAPIVVNNVANLIPNYTNNADTSVDGSGTLPASITQTFTVTLGHRAVGKDVAVFVSGGGPVPIPASAPRVVYTNDLGQVTVKLQSSSLDQYRFSVAAGGTPSTTTTTVLPTTIATTIAPTTVLPTTTTSVGGASSTTTTTSLAPTTATTLAPTTTTTAPLPTAWVATTRSMLVQTDVVGFPEFELTAAP